MAHGVGSLQEIARTIFTSSLDACSVEKAFASRLRFVEEGRLLLPGGDELDFRQVRRLLIISAGKGAATMLQALLRRLPAVDVGIIEGVLIAPARPSGLPQGIEFFRGGHPLPNAESMAGASAALRLLRREDVRHDAELTFCFFLISGGASAMMEQPLDTDISPEDVTAFHDALVHSGANIAEMNCVRKHFSAVKGGRLGLAAKHLASVSILVSDVPAGHLDALGSGPTLPDTSTVEQCREICQRHNLLRRFPSSVRSFFASPRLTETPKPSQLPVRAITLLSAEDLADAARARAEQFGFTAVVDNTCDDWDYQPAAEYLLRRLRELRRSHRRVCVISVGEVTVRLPAPSGLRRAEALGSGGRNQHFVLYAGTLLTPEDDPVVVFSAGSDGVDGNSPAAGGFVAGSMEHGTTAFETAEQALRRFDSYGYLHDLDATIVTGPTGNNLRDLRILLAE